jgi:hypothetical protein
MELMPISIYAGILTDLTANSAELASPYIIDSPFRFIFVWCHFFNCILLLRAVERAYMQIIFKDKVP